MPIITIYQVWSERIPSVGHRPKCIGTRMAWNDPKGGAGAVQLWDKLQTFYYRKNIRAYVSIKEVRASISLQDLKLL